MRFEVLYNEILYNSDSSETSITAIPDIVVRNGEKILILEVKFSNNPSYLSQAIFKILAYLVLFNAKTGILVYPTMRKKTPTDKEYKEIYKKVFSSENRYNEEIEKIIKINTNHGEFKIVALQLEPLRGLEKLNTDSIKKVIKQELGV